MATTRQDISAWFDRGVKEHATHLIVACDTFDWEDYPVFVKPTQKVQEEVDRIAKSSMQRVMEVYNLSLDKNSQIDGPRVHNL